MNIIQIMLHRATLGMTIAEDVYKGDQLLVPKGTVINNEVMNILRYSSVISIAVYGEDAARQQITPENLPMPTHSEKLRQTTEFKQFEQTFHETTETFHNHLNDIARRNEDILTKCSALQRRSCPDRQILMH